MLAQSAISVIEFREASIVVRIFVRYGFFVRRRYFVLVQENRVVVYLVEDEGWNAILAFIFVYETKHILFLLDFTLEFL